MDDVKRINRELMYEGSIVDIYSDTMQFSNGNTAKWDLVAHRKGAAAVVPVLDNGKISAVGTHEELLNTSEIYKDIYNSQLNRK